MKRVVICILTLCLLLSGCSGLLDGNYHDVKAHEVKSNQPEEEILSVSNYTELKNTLVSLIENGTQSGIISVAQYQQKNVESDMERAITEVCAKDPIAAYAVSEITFDLGTTGGQNAVAVSISYIHDRAEIRKIQHMESSADAEAAIAQALDSCDSGIVLYIEAYEQMDFTQWVANYAAANPDRVMETPTVTDNVYPAEGSSRVVELKFSYTYSRDDLRTMQAKVLPMFNAAMIYAGGENMQEQFFKLYSFLMGLSPEFQLETSITPSYSLLQHGVGDSRAFATVYAAMCSRAGLECITVVGTRDGEPWYWNIVLCDGLYYHVDLLRCHQTDDFRFCTDGEMNGYVWDYPAYPACDGSAEEQEPENTEAAE